MSDQHLIRKVTEEERNKLNTLEQEGRFYAADMSLQKNEMYRNIDRYSNVEKVEQEAAFAEKMLQLPSSAQLDLSAEKRTSLTMNLNRKQNFLLLNDGKFSGDSKEMQRVKTELGNLELLLSERGVLNYKELTEIDQAYRKAFRACQNYVKNKNPWFATGKRRMDKVKATMKRLVQEQRCLAAGAEMVRKGLVDKKKIKTPYDLIKAEMTEKLAAQQKKEKYAEKCKRDQAVSDQWLPDFFEAMAIKDYLKEAKKINPTITDEDAKWHIFRKFWKLIGSYSPVKLIEVEVNGKKTGEKRIKEKTGAEKLNFPPMLQEFGLAGALERKGRLLGAAEGGSGSREIAPSLYLVKRDKQGKPLNQEEAEKDAFNKRWLNDFDAFYEAKGEVVATEKAAEQAETEIKAAEEKLKKLNEGEKAEELRNLIQKKKGEIEAAEKKLLDLKAAEKTAADQVFANFRERLEKAVNTIVLPDAEEIKKDPSLIEKLVFRNIDECLYLLTMPGQWDELLKYVAPEQMTQYGKEHPEVMEFLDIATKIYSTMLKEKMNYDHHYDEDKSGNLKSDTAGKLEKLKKEGASPDEIQYQQEVLQEEAKAFQDTMQDYIVLCEDTAVNMKDYHAAVSMSKHASVYKWKWDTSLRTEVRVDVKFRKEQGFQADWLQIEVMDGLQNAVKTLNEGYAKKDAFGPAGGLLYFPKYRDSDPYDEQDQERVEWNQKWINCLKGNHAEEKKTMMREGMDRVLSCQLPSPAEITERGILSVINDDPFYYAQMMHNVSHFEKLKEVDVALFEELMPAGSLKEKKFRMMEKFTSWLKKTLFVHGIEQNAEGKWTYASKNATAEDKKDAQKTREEFEQNYLEVMNEDGLQTVKQQVLTDTYLNEKLTEAKEKDPLATKETVYLAEIYKEVEKQREEAIGTAKSGLFKRALDLKLVTTGDATRLLTAGLYYIKKDASGNPANEEEERKAEHNRLWVDALSRWIDSKDPAKFKDPAAAAAEEKKAARDIMSAVFRVWSEQSKQVVSNLEGIKTAEDYRNYALKDPFLFLNVQCTFPCFDMLNNHFPEEMKALKKQIPGLENIRKITGSMSGISHILNNHYGLDGYGRIIKGLRPDEYIREEFENQLKEQMETEILPNYQALKKAQGKDDEIPPQPEQTVIQNMEVYEEKNQQIENNNQQILNDNQQILNNNEQLQNNIQQIQNENQQIQNENQQIQNNQQILNDNQQILNNNEQLQNNNQQILNTEQKQDQKQEKTQIEGPKVTEKKQNVQKPKKDRIQKMEEELEQKPEFKKFYKEVESTPEAMDEQLVKVQVKKEFADFEEGESANLDKFKIRKQNRLSFLVGNYSNGYFKNYNKVLRGHGEDVPESDKENAVKLKEGLKNITINRNIVVRREVRGLDTLANMMNLQIDKKKSDYADQLKDAIKGKVAEKKDVILTDPGFISTTFDPGVSFLSPEDGVEFIINVKKGTQATDIVPVSTHSHEREILLNAGTKFKLVKVFYNGCSGEEERPLCQEQLDGKEKYSYTDRKIWKVYLETIPSEKEGQLK